MWYYEWNKQPFGPVSKETVADTLKAGKIDATTRVWQEGMTEWKRLDETQLAVLVGVTPPVESEIIPAVLPQVGGVVIPPAKITREQLKKLFWWWFVLLAGSVPFYVLTQLFPDETWAVSLSCFYEIPLLASAVLQYLLIYKFWQVVQDGSARTTPGKAIGFLFIPIFNFYWYFVAFFGLAKDLNNYAERYFSTNPVVTIRKTHPILPLSFVVFYLLQMSFSVYMYIKLITTSLTAIADASQMTNLLTPYSLPSLILFIVHTLLLMIMFWEFHQTTGDILAAEEKTPSK